MHLSVGVVGESEIASVPGESCNVQGTIGLVTLHYLFDITYRVHKLGVDRGMIIGIC